MDVKNRGIFLKNHRHFNIFLIIAILIALFTFEGCTSNNYGKADNGNSSKYNGVADLSQSSDEPSEVEGTVTVSSEKDVDVSPASEVVTVTDNNPDQANILADFPDNCVNNTVDYKKIYEMYLEQLLSNKEGIQKYFWQMGYYGSGEITEDKTPRPINITDINGDDIPELIYVSIQPDYRASTDLHIYEYTGGKLVELYSGAWDYNAGGGFKYVLFKTSVDSSLYAFYSEGDIWREDNYDVFTAEDDCGLTLKQLYQYSDHEGNGSERDIHYYDGDNECDETAYTTGINEIQGKITGIVMMSMDCNQAIGAGSVFNSAMTYEEAIAFLKQGIGITEVKTSDGTQPDWSSPYEQFVTEYLFKQRGTEDYGSETDYLIGLYDFENDGIPELIIHNGYFGRVMRCAYGYTFDGNDIVYVGICPSEAYYLNNANYSGLLGRFSDSSEAYWHYYHKSGDTISSESVYTEISSANSSEYQQTTTDQNLFNACIEEKTYFDKLYTIDEILIMGWDSFVDKCLN